MVKPLKILIAPDSFKGSLSANEVAEALARGLMRANSTFEVSTCPMSDGGEGTVRSLVDATDGRIVQRTVTGPLGEPVEAFFGILGDGRTAVIEMAAASGLPLVPIKRRNPMVTTTYGTGELIRTALDEGCRELIIGIGGSATNDGGVGMAQALGGSFRDASGREVGYGGKRLRTIQTIELGGLDPRLAECRIQVACDVDNPLYGERGAAHIYGPQKGATPEMVQELDLGLRHLAEVVLNQHRVDVAEIPGAGAAGGLGAGLVAFLRAELKPGVDIITEAIHLKERLRGMDLVITGEGRIDFQTVFGKTPIGVARVAKRCGIPVIGIAGSIGQGAEAVYEAGIDALFSIINAPMNLETAIANASELLEQTGENIGRLLQWMGS